MKTTTSILPVYENWSNKKHRLQQLFTWLTGYDIILEGSREDLAPEKMLSILKSRKNIQSN
jgi:hypothetical protein